MSLDVPEAMIDQARTGEIDDAQFVSVIRRSLPYAWSVITEVVGDLGLTRDRDFADHTVPPPDEAARGQLLRALASDSIRGALERHFGVKLAFQNCHRVAAFRPATVDGESYRKFVSTRSQVLNQTPEFRDC